MAQFPAKQDLQVAAKSTRTAHFLETLAIVILAALAAYAAAG
jgi:hypothetical protein